MHDFQYINNRLHCEGVALESLAKKFGTPLYVYSQRTLTRHFQKLDKAMSGVDHLICFAVKSNSNQSVLRALAKAGSAGRRKPGDADVFAVGFGFGDLAVDAGHTAVVHGDFFGVVGRMIGAAFVAGEPLGIDAEHEIIFRSGHSADNVGSK